MWLILETGCYSIVEKSGTDYLTVRARVREDLENLRKYIPDLGPILRSQETDYEFRCHVDHAGFAAGMVKAVMNVRYHNFKSHIAKTSGTARHDVYGRVWSVLSDGLEAISGRTSPAKSFSTFRDHYYAWPTTTSVSTGAWNADTKSDDAWWESMSPDEQALYMYQIERDEPAGGRATTILEYPGGATDEEWTIVQELRTDNTFDDLTNEELLDLVRAWQAKEVDGGKRSRQGKVDAGGRQGSRTHSR